MRVLVRRAYSGWGYLASPADDLHAVIHSVGFDEVIVEFASKQPSLCPSDGSPPRLHDLAVTLLGEQYGQYLLEVSLRATD